MTIQNNALPSARKPVDIRALLDNWAMLLAAVGIFVLCALLIDNFLSPLNMRGLGLAISTVGIAACTMLFCLASGHFDLSVGSVIACAGVVAAIVMRDTDSVMLGIGAALLMGLMVGLINGIVIAKLRVNALITTLATMQIVRGLAYIFADGKAVGVSQEQFFVFGNGQLFGVPVPILITIVCFLFFGWLLNYTTYGRNTMAIGGNPEAAKVSGVNVARNLVVIYMIAGIFYAFGGMLEAGRIGSATNNLGFMYELDAIAACVVGGVSFAGGVGTVIGVVTGVLIFTVINYGLTYIGVNPYWQYIIKGSIIIFAVAIDSLKYAKKK